jgi:hypothetical protein
MTPYNTFLSSRPKGEIFVFLKINAHDATCGLAALKMTGSALQRVKTLKQKPVIPAKAGIQPACIRYYI